LKNTYTFLLVVLVVALSTFLFQYFLNPNELVYNFYSEQLAQEQIEELIESQEKWQWLGYAFIPLIILLRTSLVAMALSIGLFFFDMENTTKYKQLFKVALLGEFVLALVSYFKFLYFYLIKDNFTFLEIQQFQPLSLANFVDVSTIDSWLLYPLQTINLFEIFYFFILVYGLQKLLKNNYWKSVKITAVSYGAGLTIWIGLVMFLILNMS